MFDRVTMFVGTIVAKAQHQSYLLECKYIFFPGYFTNVSFVTLVEDDDELARRLLISFMF
jgi:hypothetical protein